jgi:hypothetical protein
MANHDSGESDDSCTGIRVPEEINFTIAPPMEVPNRLDQ